MVNAQHCSKERENVESLFKVSNTNHLELKLTQNKHFVMFKVTKKKLNG